MEMYCTICNYTFKIRPEEEGNYDSKYDLKDECWVCNKKINRKRDEYDRPRKKVKLSRVQPLKKFNEQMTQAQKKWVKNNSQLVQLCRVSWTVGHRSVKSKP